MKMKSYIMCLMFHRPVVPGWSGGAGAPGSHQFLHRGSAEEVPGPRSVSEGETYQAHE